MLVPARDTADVQDHVDDEEAEHDRDGGNHCERREHAGDEGEHRMTVGDLDTETFGETATGLQHRGRPVARLRQDVRSRVR